MVLETIGNVAANKWQEEIAKFGAFRSLSDWNRVFGRIRGEEWADRPQWTPAVSVHQGAEFMLISIDLPGINVADVEVLLQGDILTVRGQRPLEYAAESYSKVQRPHGAFSWSLNLPPGIDADRTAAQYTNGVLHIKVPRRKIEAAGADVVSTTEQEEAAASGGQAVSSPEEVSKGMNSDLNYEAYLRDVPELKRKFAGYVVAYADGKRVGEARNALELAERLPETYRKRGLFITDVSPKPVRFRRPFRVLEK